MDGQWDHDLISKDVRAASDGAEVYVGEPVYDHRHASERQRMTLFLLRATPKPQNASPIHHVSNSNMMLRVGQADGFFIARSIGGDGLADADRLSRT